MLQHIDSVKLNNTNIIIILTDQQRHDAVGYTNPNIITPNLNKLASESIVCTKAFVQSPQCQPSRASILTGRYPTAHKVWWNSLKLNDSEITIGNILANAGYNTGYFGKLHVDRDYESHTDVAKSLGFNHSFLSEDWQSIVNGKLFSAKPKMCKEFFQIMGTKTWTGKLTTHRSFHHDDVIVDEALRFIKSQSKSFLAMISFHGPHPPYAAPTEFAELYDVDKMKAPKRSHPNLKGYTLTDQDWKELKKQYYGLVSWIDDNIGKILNAVDDNTIIVFMSDHGDMLGDHGHFSKGIFAYDGNTRIPMLIKLPGLNGGTYQHLVQAIDILPTLLDVVGVKIPVGVQGKKLLDGILSNQEVNKYVVSMLGHTDRLRMLRTDSVKYWLRHSERKSRGVTEYLYDLNVDPREVKNLAKSQDAELLLNAARFDLLKALILCEDKLPLVVK